MLTTTEAIKWLKEDRRRISLFFRIAEARLIEGPVDQRTKELIDYGLVKSDRCGTRLSEEGWKVFEGIEAISLLDKIP